VLKAYVEYFYKEKSIRGLVKPYQKLHLYLLAKVKIVAIPGPGGLHHCYKRAA